MTAPRNVIGRVAATVKDLAAMLGDISVELEAERGRVRALLAALPRCEGGCGAAAVQVAHFEARDDVLICAACAEDVKELGSPREGDGFVGVEDLPYRIELEAILGERLQPSATSEGAPDQFKCPECGQILIVRPDPDPAVPGIAVDCGPIHVVTYSDSSEAHVEAGEPVRYIEAKPEARERG